MTPTELLAAAEKIKDNAIAAARFKGQNGRYCDGLFDIRAYKGGADHVDHVEIVMARRDKPPIAVFKYDTRMPDEYGGQHVNIYIASGPWLEQFRYIIPSRNFKVTWQEFTENEPATFHCETMSAKTPEDAVLLLIGDEWGTSPFPGTYRQLVGDRVLKTLQILGVEEGKPCASE
jgi:hypothetical protein